MASWNGQNKRRKSKGFKKDRRKEELKSRYESAVSVESSKRNRQFELSIERELADDLIEEELERQETEFLIRRHS